MTFMTQAVAEVIKTDVLGRMRTSAARRESLLNEFEKSGLSGTKFAQLSGIKYQTLATWLQKRRRQGQAPVKEASPVRWLEAVVEQAQKSGAQNPAVMVLQLPGGVRLEVADERQAALAAVLVRALAGSC